MKRRLSFKNNTMMFSLLLVLVLLLGGVVYAAPSIVNNIIITPSELEGVAGANLNPEDIFVQEVGLTRVKILDVNIVDDNNRVLKRFPSESGKYAVVNKENKKKVGFIDLKVLNAGDVIPIAYNLRGEYLFYQEGSVFNSLKSAKEGTLYFWRKSDKHNAPPMILNIGEVQDGMFEGRDFIRVKNKVIQIKKGM